MALAQDVVGQPSRPSGARLEKESRPGDDEADLRIASQPVGLHCEMVGWPPVVGIQESDQGAARGSDSGVPCGTHAAVWATQYAGSQLLGYRRAAIDRAIVDDDDLERRMTLGLSRGDRLSEEALSVEDRNDDADARRAQLDASNSSRMAGGTADMSDPSSRR
jgi:hypothetical protein